MGDKTGISWTHHSWNPWQGCQKVSPGCDHCYMFRDKLRYGQDPEDIHRSAPATFNRPLRWEREAAATGVHRLVFTASWSDVFAKKADAWRGDMWSIVRRTPHLIYQMLTKLPTRIEQCLPDDWGPNGYPNVWLGVSAENAEWWARRVPVLRSIPARVRFVSYEPALEEIVAPDLGWISWVITGGESGGSEARPFHVEWARTMGRACRAAGVSHFVKQMGSHVRWDGCTSPDRGEYAWPRGTDARDSDGLGGWRVHLRDRHGAEPSEWPKDLRVQEWPAGFGSAIGRPPLVDDGPLLTIGRARG